MGSAGTVQPARHYSPFTLLCAKAARLVQERKPANDCKFRLSDCECRVKIKLKSQVCHLYSSGNLEISIWIVSSVLWQFGKEYFYQICQILQKLNVIYKGAITRKKIML